GRVSTNFANGGVAKAIAVQSDGRIVVGGATSSAAGLSPAFARYLPSGAPDPLFGVNGKNTFDLPGTSGTVNDLALQSDGKIVAVGDADLDFLVLRLNANGFIDQTFGGTGFVITNLGIRDDATAVAIQPDGKIIVAGTTDQAPTVCAV